MPEDLKPAQTNEPETVAKTEPVVDKAADLVVEKPKQTDEQNAEQARRRRQDDERKALEKRELQTAIKLTGGKNPFTQEKIEDQQDLDELYLMKEIEAKGGDPIADFAKHLKQKRKEESTKVQEKTMNEEQASEDLAAFQTAHPGITLKSLQEDQRFLKFAKGKIGNMPLAEIYSDYLEFAPVKPDPEIAKKAAIEAKKVASTGALGTSGATEEYFTRDQVKNMTEDQIRANIVKIRKSKDKWPD